MPWQRAKLNCLRYRSGDGREGVDQACCCCCCCCCYPAPPIVCVTLRNSRWSRARVRSRSRCSPQSKLAGASPRWWPVFGGHGAARRGGAPSRRQERQKHKGCTEQFVPTSPYTGCHPFQKAMARVSQQEAQRTGTSASACSVGSSRSERLAPSAAESRSVTVARAAAHDSGSRAINAFSVLCPGPADEHSMWGVGFRGQLPASSRTPAHTAAATHPASAPRRHPSPRPGDRATRARTDPARACRPRHSSDRPRRQHRRARTRRTAGFGWGSVSRRRLRPSCCRRRCCCSAAASGAMTAWEARGNGVREVDLDAAWRQRRARRRVCRLAQATGGCLVAGWQRQTSHEPAAVAAGSKARSPARRHMPESDLGGALCFPPAGPGIPCWARFPAGPGGGGPIAPAACWGKGLSASPCPCQQRGRRAAATSTHPRSPGVTAGTTARVGGRRCGRGGSRQARRLACAAESQRHGEEQQLSSSATVRCRGQRPRCWWC
jgi:hypothetical protein